MDTFDGDHIDDYDQAVNALLTTKAKTKFKQSFQAFDEGLPARQGQGTGKLHAAGMEDTDDDSATVLVVHDGSVKSTPATRSSHLRWSVQLVKVDGAWLVDDFKDGGSMTTSVRPGTTCSASPATPTPERSRPPGARPPTSSSRAAGQFRMFNEAADVLLDPARGRRTTPRWTPPTGRRPTPSRRRSRTPSRGRPPSPPPSRRPASDRPRDSDAPAGPAGARWPRPGSPSPVAAR